MANIRNLYTEARTVGFDPRIMCQIIKMRELDKLVLAEQDILLSTYCAAIGHLK